MQKISLKDWVVLLTIVPTTLIGIAIASYFSYNSYVELNEFLALRSTSIIEPLAIASAEHLNNRDREKLRHLIGFAHRNHSSLVKSISVYTIDNQIFVTSAYHGDAQLMKLEADQAIPDSTTYKMLDDYMIFQAPIINERHQDQNNLQQTKIGYISIQIDRNKNKFNQQSELIIAFLIVLIGSVISAIFTFRLIKNVTRPVTAMVQAVDRIREGKLESRVSGQLIGELNFLKNGINAMAQSIGDYHDEMQRSIDQATLDLRESLEQFEIQNVELDIAKRKAQDANRVKSEFLANMSHELRTPLNGVIGFTRQVLKTPLTNTQRDYLQTIERSANNLLSIINDILDFSKLDAGKMLIENIPYALRDSIEEALVLLAPSTNQKNIELSLRIAPQIPDALIGDAMRVKQILINLTNNAIKFTEKGSVTIDVDTDYIDDKSISLKFTITDTGIGMNNEQKSTLFEAFNQADKSVTRLYGGTGLGLVISKRLAHEMHGDIGFHSEEGRGSTFWFTALCELNPIQFNQLFDNQHINNKRILYFESQTHSRITTNELLESWGLQVSPITQIEQLITALDDNEQYDFALIAQEVSPTALNDIKELIALIRPKIPSIHIAINSNSPSLQEALIAAGASSCLNKPITPKRLYKALQPASPERRITSHNIINQKAPIKVLAVDDNEANLKLIEALLHEQVMEVATAVNGKQAVEMCETEKFALVFMDIQMPVMDGVSALKVIKNNTFNDDTPIIAVTAHALAGEKEKLLKQGFHSYMTKPIDETMLKHIIYEYCDVELLVSPLTSQQNIKQFVTQKHQSTKNIDWELALKRASYKEDLAKDMLSGLLKSLPDTKLSITDALTCQDIEQTKTLIHKLNGACCYSGVPNLSRVTNEIETQLKKDISLDDLEPEFFELFEHMETLISLASENFSDMLTEQS
jgi:two-component system sensor histidine kinase BarA